MSRDCYGLKSKDSVNEMHVGDSQVNEMMGKFKDHRMDKVGRTPFDMHESVSNAKKVLDEKAR